jgi:hypothetical protein
MTAISVSETDGAFQELILVGITKNGGSEVQFASISDLGSISGKPGNKDGEGVPLGNGGRIWKRTPEGDVEVSLKIYPLSVNVVDATDMAQYFLGGTYDTTAPIVQVGTHDRSLFRVALLWTDDSTVTTAGGSTTAAKASRRHVFKDLRVTGYEPDFGDGMLSATVTFKGPAFTKANVSTYQFESVKSTDSAGLSALSNY